MTNLYRECGWCGEALDENCNAIGKYRKEIGVVITHGLCCKCEAEYFPEDEPIPDTEPSPMVFPQEPDTKQPE